MSKEVKWTRLATQPDSDRSCLADGYKENTIFSSPSWVNASLDHLLGKRKPLLLEFNTPERKTHRFVFTLGWERIGGLLARTLRLAGFPYVDRLVFNEQAEVIEALVNAISDLHEPWDIAILDEVISADLPHVSRAAKLLPAKFWTRVRYCSHTPILYLEPMRGVDPYTCYSKSLRTRVKRARKKLAASGDVKFERFHKVPLKKLNEILAIIASIEGQSWKGVADVGIFNQPTRDFFFQLSRGLNEAGQLEIIVLYLDQQPIGYRYGFRFENTYYDYNFAQLPEFNHLSPGRILLDEVIHNSLQEGLIAIDGSRGSIERPQLLCDWTDDYIDHHVFWIGNRTLPGLAAKLAVNQLRPLLQGVKEKLTKAGNRVAGRRVMPS